MRLTLLFLMLVLAFPVVARDQAAREAVEALEAYAVYKMAQYDEAFRRFQALANKGNVQGMLNLANMLQAGLGTGRDAEAALEWYRRAADKGSAIGMFYTGLAYLDGQGIAVDTVKAELWMTRAAEAGSGAAQLQLGKMFLARGDTTTARIWITMAANSGEAAAQALLRALDSNQFESDEVAIADQVLIKSAWAAIDRAAVLRNAPGTIHYLAHDARVRLRLPESVHWIELDRVGYRQFWQQSFDRADNIQLSRINPTFSFKVDAIIASAQLLETLLIDGIEQNLTLFERAKIRIHEERVVIDQLDVTINYRD